MKVSKKEWEKVIEDIQSLKNQVECHSGFIEHRNKELNQLSLTLKSALKSVEYEFGIMISDVEKMKETIVKFKSSMKYTSVKRLADIEANAAMSRKVLSDLISETLARFESMEEVYNLKLEKKFASMVSGLLQK